MKNKLFPIIFALPAVAGICGAVLRASQIKEAFQHNDGFIAGGTPFANGLIVLCAFMFVIALGLSLLFTKCFKSSKDDMPKNYVSIPFYLSGAIILAYAALLLSSLLRSFETVSLILLLFSLYCAVSLFLLGKYKLAERESTAYCVMSAVPVFWACFMLILTFREKISDPVIWDYVFHIFAYLSILFSTYCIAAHTLGKNKRSVTVFSCFMGIFFFLIELISPFISGGFIELNLAKITELLPEIAFLIIIPVITVEALKK